jgi:hypothetical protein
LRRHIRAVVAGLVLLLALLALAVALSWHFSSFALAPDHSPYSEAVDIKAVSARRITLSRSEASERPGYYGLAWQAGHAIVGPGQRLASKATCTPAIQAKRVDCHTDLSASRTRSAQCRRG